MALFKHIWDKSKDGNRKEERSLIRVGVVAFSLALVFLLFKKDNLIRWAQGGFAIMSQNREIKANRDRIEALDAKIYALENNRDSLEKFARETYRFSVPGEDVYLIEER